MPGRGSVRPAGSDALARPRGSSRGPTSAGAASRSSGTPSGPGDRLGEEHRVLVGEQVQVDVEVGVVRRTAPGPSRRQSRRSLETASAEPRPERAVGDVGHDVQAEARDPGDPRVLDAGVVGAALPRLVGLEDDALRARRRPVRRPRRIDLGQADARDVARRRPGAGAGTARRPAPRPRAGLSTPSASSGLPGSGVITTPSRVSV